MHVRTTPALFLFVASVCVAQSASPWIDWETGEGPIAREHTSVLVDGDRAVFFGGSGYEPQLAPLADAWAVSLETGEWVVLETRGDVPSGGGSRRVAAAGDGSFLLWGGYGEGFALNNELVRATLEDGGVVYARIEQREAPDARALHGFVHDAERDRYIMFGAVS